MSNQQSNRVQAGVREGGQFATGARDESGVALADDGHAPECAMCGQPVERDAGEVVYHLTDDGEYDYDTDADHVALPMDGYNEYGPPNLVMHFEMTGAEGHFEVDAHGNDQFSVFKVDGESSEQLVTFDYAGDPEDHGELETAAIGAMELYSPRALPYTPEHLAAP